MATLPRRGDCWVVDLGMVAKVRPCLVLSIPADEENDRVLMTIIPHTTSIRGSRFEVAVDAKFLKSGAFDVQQVASIPNIKLLRRIGSLSEVQLAAVEAALCRWLGLPCDPKTGG